MQTTPRPTPRWMLREGLGLQPGGNVPELDEGIHAAGDELCAVAGLQKRRMKSGWLAGSGRMTLTATSRPTDG